MFLRDFFRAVAYESSKLFEAVFSYESPSDRMRKQLRIVFGKGEIDRETFFKLRRNLDLGYTIEGELKMLHRQALRRLEIEGIQKEFPLSSEYQKLLDEVYINRARVEEARAEVTQALSVVEENQRWLVEKIEESKRLGLPVTGGDGTTLSLTAGESAKIVQGIMRIDTEANRLFGIAPTTLYGVPARSGGLIDHLALLNQRIEMAKQNLQMLDSLEEHLRLFESEIIVRQAGDHLALTENTIQKHLQ